MFAGGLIEEARRLRALDRPLSREAQQAAGYQEVFAMLDGDTALADAIVRVKTRSRNLAKRQMTWFRHLEGCRPASKALTAASWQSKMYK
jgi:tRNA dimethylallyltransferase